MVIWETKDISSIRHLPLRNLVKNFRYATVLSTYDGAIAVLLPQRLGNELH